MRFTCPTAVFGLYLRFLELPSRSRPSPPCTHTLWFAYGGYSETMPEGRCSCTSPRKSRKAFLCPITVCTATPLLLGQLNTTIPTKRNYSNYPPIPTKKQLTPSTPWIISYYKQKLLFSLCISKISCIFAPWSPHWGLLYRWVGARRHVERRLLERVFMLQEPRKFLLIRYWAIATTDVLGI